MISPSFSCLATNSRIIWTSTEYSEYFWIDLKSTLRLSLVSRDYCGGIHQRLLRVHPLVREDLLRRKPLLGFDDHLLDEVECLSRLSFPLGPREVEDSFLDLLEDLFVRVSVERRIATENDVEDHSCRPYVTLLVVAPFEDFRRDVERLGQLAATVPALVCMIVFGLAALVGAFRIGLCTSLLIFTSELKKFFDKPKSISFKTFSLSFSRNRKFSGFRSLLKPSSPVADSFVVAVVDRLDDLPEYISSFGFPEVFFVNDSVEELSAFAFSV